MSILKTNLAIDKKREQDPLAMAIRNGEFCCDVPFDHSEKRDVKAEFACFLMIAVSGLVFYLYRDTL